MAGSQQERPPTSVWVEEKGSYRNLSTNSMRPLWTSCREHYQQQEKDKYTYDQWHSSPCNNGGIIKNTSRSNSSSSQPTTRRPRFLTLNSLPRMPSPSPESKRKMLGSPFLRLPTEIRLQIYALLVLPARPTDLLASYVKVSSSTQDYFDYDRKQFGTDRTSQEQLQNPTLHIRTIEPSIYKQRHGEQPQHAKSSYSVRADRFRARCMQTTYHCVNNPRIEGNLGILRANKQIHAEACELLYSSYTFDFDTHVEAILPFLSDLTPFARSCIKSMRIVKRAIPYLNEFDRCEWANALRYVTSPHSNINLHHLELGVVAGRPGQNGWDRVAKYSATDFNLLCEMEGMEWMQYLLEMEGLHELDVQAVIEHCPPVTSSTAMANYVRFSASVESGFSEFLKGRLLVPVAA
ncbi:hypothetical protein HII31_10826 [Pseudocercospora fuligena]|uniref:Uncharacterized protein n=1 Tax=Pseudocercospora fuligena TaxID=685502 RepID=A0A8H6RDA0_9PEZI|nr:hypothetical protein HII31_10826 [Pseudocercospora fuligena]